MKAGGPRREVVVERSKCLTQSDKDLRGFDSGRRVEVVTQIHTYRTHWSFVTEADANRIGIVRGEAAESDARKDVATIIKGGQTQPLLNRQRDAKLRIHDEEFSAALGRLNLAAGCGIGRIAAHSDFMLWTCAVQRKPA